MKERILFINTYNNYHTNGANRSYWAKFFRLIAKELKDANKMSLHSSFSENMPIYEYYSESKGRYVSILQYDPYDEVVADNNYSADRFYTAWIDKRLIRNKELTVPELVICLLMTKSNIAKADILIRTWLFENEGKTMDLIEKIYDEQKKMDDEADNKRP